jgi:transposase
MSQDRFFTARVFSAAFKQAAIARVEAGEPIGAVAHELGLARRVLYRWREAWRAEGVAGLNRKRGRKVGWRKRPPGASPENEPRSKNAASLRERAERRIAELERLVGRQQADLDFFRRALQALDATASEGTSATDSTRSSRR